MPYGLLISNYDRLSLMMMNALEEQLYTIDSFNDYKVLNQALYTQPYERGMGISITNYKMHYEHLVQQLKRQYQSIYSCLTNKKISRDDIKQIKGIPGRNSIMDCVYKKVPLLVAGIHNNPTEDNFNHYQHSHFYLYNLLSQHL